MVENKLTHYEILSVPHHATPDQVKKAYRKASLKYHPDKTGRGQEDYVFLAVKRAYDHLMDPVKRQVSFNFWRERNRVLSTSITSKFMVANMMPIS